MFFKKSRARRFCKCFNHHRKFWNMLSSNLADEEILRHFKGLFKSFEVVKIECMRNYCGYNHLNIPEHYCFACEISNIFNRWDRCQSDTNYLPCMLDWGKSRHCFNAGTPYSRLQSLYKNDHDPNPAVLSKLAKKIADLPLNPESFYIYVDMYPGDHIRHRDGVTYTFDSVSQNKKTGELIANYSFRDTSYSLPLSEFIEEIIDEFTVRRNENV